MSTHPEAHDTLSSTVATQPKPPQASTPTPQSGARTPTRKELSPFGLELCFPPGSTWQDVDTTSLQAQLATHRVIVLRGIDTMNRFALVSAAKCFGTPQPWSFGAINELKVKPQANNYLFTESKVPLHWDGAFAGVIPHTLFFQCLQAPPPDCGGETIFVDTSRVLANATADQRAQWQDKHFTYSTEKLAYYGGSFTAALLQPHPHHGTDTLRYAEPVTDRNPVTVEAVGIDKAEADALQADLHRALSHPDVILAHTWQQGDIVLADNHTLLHGRNAFTAPNHRHIQRVNLLDTPPPTFWRKLAASLRIRRPEFMVAEIPILLLPLLLLPAPGFLSNPLFWQATVVFFLLFHFGDMVNCLADRDLDAVYKTSLSQAVTTLGVPQVRTQIILSALAATGITAAIAWQTQRWWLLPLVLFGLALGAAYSLPPSRLKGRGLLQIPTLWALIFFGPMLFLLGVFANNTIPWHLLLFAAIYGIIQEGVILINTAEDIDEDQEAQIITSARALGLRNTVATSAAMIFLAGACLLAWFVTHRNMPTWPAKAAIAAFSIAWTWVSTSVCLLWWRLRQQPHETQIIHVKRAAGYMPLWITAIAWASLALALLTTPI